MFLVSQQPSSGVLKTVTAASGTGHNIVTATSLQRGPIGPRWREVRKYDDRGDSAVTSAVSRRPLNLEARF